MHNLHDERRKQAELIWRAGVEVVQPNSCLPRALDDLSDIVGGWSPERHYLVIGGGKAGAAMAQAVEHALLMKGIPADRLSGWVNVPAGSKPQQLQRIHLHTARPAGYNFPTPEAVLGTQQMLKLLDEAPDHVVILCLISGGGSAILCAPVPEVPLEDKIMVSKQLSAAGASINELNAVRKHLSLFKGGRLAQRVFPSNALAAKRQFISLIISDVIGDPLDVIASGPTAVDTTTFADALEVLRTRKILNTAPASAVRYLQTGEKADHPETLKKYPASEPALVHRIVANNQQALTGATEKARALGYEVVNLGDRLEGDTLELAAQFVKQLPYWRSQKPVCVVSGGETTVRLPARHGKGGRNQSCSLSLLAQLKSQLKGVTVLCAGTDGEDGPTDAAGAFADIEIYERSKQLKLDADQHLQEQNAYEFFEATGGLFKTGLTETNVMDLRVFLIDPAGA